MFLNRLNTVNYSYAYRFGYQGSEKDDEIFGSTGTAYTTHFRGLDTRVVRWWSVDPKTNLTPWESPYASMGLNPIWHNDPLGDIFDKKSKRHLKKFKHKLSERTTNVRENIKGYENTINELKSQNVNQNKISKVNELLNNEQQILSNLEDAAKELDLMDKSEQLFKVRFTTNYEGGGATEYKDNAVLMKFGSMSALADELKNGFQFISGDISFKKNGERGSLSDIGDEIASMQRRLSFSPIWFKRDNGTIPFLKEIDAKGMMKQRDKYTDDYMYKGLSTKNINIYNFKGDLSKDIYYPKSKVVKVK